MNIRFYTDSDAAQWDAFCSTAPQATFLHTRKFLSYHGDRFEDRSLIISTDDGGWIAILPAALQPGETTTLTSHPGITYGGLLTAPGVYGEAVYDILSAIVVFCRSHNIHQLLYKVVPDIYHKQPANDDLYALFRMSAERYRVDLSATIVLTARGNISSRRKRGLKKAIAAGVNIEEGMQHIEALWGVLADNLARKHDAKPVHSIAEIILLHERFPDAIQCITALHHQEVIAGILLFDAPPVSHAQYIASSAQGYELAALDSVFEHAINRAERHGMRFFDFGISNEAQGTVLNQSLYQFKHEFGAGGMVHEFYRLNCVC